MSPKPAPPSRELSSAIQALISQLPPGTADTDLLAQLIETVAELPQTGLTRGELKLLDSTLRDFQRAFAVFGKYRDRPKVSIFGSARTPPGTPLYEHARDFARALVAREFMVITGAGPGIMQAGNEGAGPDHSFGVNINLPFEQSSNPFIEGNEKLVNFKYFFTRKLTFVKESAAIALYPGGMGTLDEGFETLTLIQTGKCNPIPIIMLDVPGGSYWIEWEMFVRDLLLRKKLISPADFNLFRVTTDIDKAVAEIELFYRNYHSLRYVDDHLILRLKKPPSEALLADLNDRYPELLASGRYEQLLEAHPAEAGESEAVRSLPRIHFHFIQRRFGTLKRLIDTINLTEL